jgi:hypothetical protein
MPRPPRRIRSRESPPIRWDDESPKPFEEGPPDDDQDDGPVILPMPGPERPKREKPMGPTPKRPA